MSTAGEAGDGLALWALASTLCCAIRMDPHLISR